MTDKATTLKAAREALRAIGWRITHDDGEYRVCPNGGHDGLAYYTNDLSDAVGTARHEAERA